MSFQLYEEHMLKEFGPYFRFFRSSNNEWASPTDKYGYWAFEVWYKSNVSPTTSYTDMFKKWSEYDRRSFFSFIGWYRTNFVSKDATSDVPLLCDSVFIPPHISKTDTDAYILKRLSSLSHSFKMMCEQ